MTTTTISHEQATRLIADLATVNAKLDGHEKKLDALVLTVNGNGPGHPGLKGDVAMLRGDLRTRRKRGAWVGEVLRGVTTALILGAVWAAVELMGNGGGGGGSGAGF